MTNHKQSAIDNMKMVDEMARSGDPDLAVDAMLLAGSVLMHSLLHIGDMLLDINTTLESRLPPS